MLLAAYDRALILVLEELMKRDRKVKQGKKKAGPKAPGAGKNAAVRTSPRFCPTLPCCLPHDMTVLVSAPVHCSVC